MCVGCHKGIRRMDPQHLCRFALSGFELDGRRFVPCGVTYHMGCIQVGEPFRSRLPAGRGLAYPRTRIAPPFICEACTVRAQLGSELQKTGDHLGLLMLERMRLIDQANAWSRGTHQNYQALLGQLRRFEQAYGLTLLEPTASGASAMASVDRGDVGSTAYLLRTPTAGHTQSEDRIRFGTARALRSAASQYYVWDAQLAHPERSIRDPRTHKVYLVDGVSPTDSMGYGLMATGMARRVGDHSKPPIALTLHQILWIMAHLDAAWRAADIQGSDGRLPRRQSPTSLGGWGGCAQRSVFSTMDDLT